jgi:Spy/CpxP family protein refolding chaperone
MRARNLVTIIAAAALLGGATMTVAAFGDNDPAGMHGRGMHGQRMGAHGAGGPLGMLGRAFHLLDLSEEQHAAIKGILEQARPTSQRLREQLRDNRQTFLEAHPRTEEPDEVAIRAHVAAQAVIQANLAVHAATVRAQVIAVLTPEQLAKLEELVELRKGLADMRQGRQGARSGRGPRI